MHQAGIEKLTTGKERFSHPPHHSNVEKIDSRPIKEERSSRNVEQHCHWKVGTINVLTASDDLLLYECLRQIMRVNIDIMLFPGVQKIRK